MRAVKAMFRKLHREYPWKCRLLGHKGKLVPAFDPEMGIGNYHYLVCTRPGCYWQSPA